MRRLGQLLGLCSAVLSLAWACPAHADICTVTVSSINFGQYSPLAQKDLVSVGTLSYHCTTPPPVGIRIALVGGNSGKSVDRSMVAAGATPLHYLLTLDPLGVAPWGDGTGGSQVYFNPHPPAGATVTVPIYARIFPRQNVRPGRSYHDTITVLVQY